MSFSKLRETKLYRRVVAFTKRYERVWMPLLLLGGLFGDVLQFTALAIYTQFAFMGAYVLLCAGTLLLMSYPYAGQVRGLRGMSLAAPYVHQFTVGGLLSTSLLFYWFSGTSSVSWPLLFFVAALMLGNEFVREWFLRPTVQVGVLAFSVFSLLSIFFSFLFHSLDPVVFLLGGAASLVFMLLFVFLLVRVGQLPDKRMAMLLTIASVYALMTAAYFGNIIPPIPLAIREAGIYHNLTRAGGEYVLEGEQETWTERLIPGQVIQASPSDVLYAYTAIFAPTNLTTTIVHKWQFYDVDARRWNTVSTLPFSITGGRDGGYRGYSRKSLVTPGKWRVSVETERGQVLGRINFTVVGS